MIAAMNVPTGDRRQGKRLVWAPVLALAFMGCSESPQSVGARLQLECESIIDTADSLSSPIRFSNQDIIDVLAKDPKVKEELGEWSRNWEKYRAEHPDKWAVAYGEVLDAHRAAYQRDGRPKKIAECVIQRGVKEGRR